jgi:hypothetical protein
MKPQTKLRQPSDAGRLIEGVKRIFIWLPEQRSLRRDVQKVIPLLQSGQLDDFS